MKNRLPNYQNLFSLLISLGFQENHQGQISSRPRVFFHQQSDTILAYARGSDEPITPADMLSTEVHLQVRGITDQPLDTLLITDPIVAP